MALILPRLARVWLRSPTSTRVLSSLAQNHPSLTATPYYYHPNFRAELRDTFQQSFLIYDNFITADEEEALAKEVEPHLKRQVYEKDHWDDAISGFRETERKHWNAKNLPVIHRVQKFGFEPHHKLLPYVHVLDLAPAGFIKPHIDSARFCGDVVAVLSLLSDSLARFVHDQDKDQRVDCIVRRRSLYVMKDSSRYDFTHEILPKDEPTVQNQIERSRRISIVCRCEPDGSKREGS
eukprot:maker-scaffold224_size251237-snap-gene-1.52 protein:Tk05458 transcript:maker-scaffold224_size251237-snap-gene-1.52-mRNA-1 annotation:"alkylated dna repair protein alkb-like protein 7"